MLCFRLAGITPESRLAVQRSDRGSASSLAHLVRRMAGNPSGPEAAFGLNSLITSMKSSLVIDKLFSCIPSGRRRVVGGGEATGELNTDWYWSSRISAMVLGSFVMMLLLGLSKGPTLDLTFLLFFA